jgi:hypothetical protein
MATIFSTNINTTPFSKSAIPIETGLDPAGAVFQ